MTFKIKKFSIIIIVTFFSISLYAQWTGSGTEVVFTARRVGIGVSSPTYGIEVRNNAANSQGTATFFGTQIASHFSYGAAEGTYIRGGKPAAQVYVNDVAGMGNINLGNGSNGVLVNGYIKIGAVNTRTGYKLFVDQGILTEKVKVAVATSAQWSDHVFNQNYNLMPLEQVEQFIRHNKHLPGIPSAAEMVKEGNDLGKTDAKLLEKIEELTLYLIQLKKENEAFRVMLNQLNRKPEQVVPQK